MTSRPGFGEQDVVTLAGYADGARLDRRGERIVRALWRFVRRKPLGAAGAIVLLIMVIMAFGADVIAPNDPLVGNPTIKLNAPSVAHPFGTDELGRDVFSRIVYGARPSLYTGMLVVLASAVLGLALGTLSAYLGGAFDLVVQRLIDSLLAFPGLILAMALLAVFSSGIHIGGVVVPLVWHSIPLMVFVTLIVLYVPSMSRVIRSATLGIIHSPYVDAARTLGCGTGRIVVRHLIPNVMATAIVLASAQLGGVILIEASLSFLGFGVPPPHPSWGSMLQGGGRSYMETSPWLAIFPGLAISLGVLAFNLFGDALRDVLDPRLRGSGGKAAV